MPQITAPTVAFQALITSTALTSAFATMTGGVNSNGAIIDAATSSPTVSTLIKRDASGGAQVVSLGVIPVAGANPGINVAAPNTYTGTPYAYSKTGGGSMSIGNDASVTAVAFHGPADSVAANAIVAASIAAGAITTAAFNAGAVAPSATTAGSFTTPQTFTSTIADYKATPGTAGVINIAAGGGFRDANGAVVPGANAQTYNLPTQPTGTNFEYIGLSLATATGALTATIGTLNAAESALLMPVANEPICSILWPGVTTLPSGIVPSANIRDLRGGGGGAGSGTGGGGAPTTPAYWVYGTPPGTIANAVDSSATQATDYMAASNVRTAATDASIADVLNNTVAPNTVPLITSTGASVSIVGPWAVNLGGTFRKVAAGSSVSATASGTANQKRYLIADVNSGTSVNLTLSASAAVAGKAMVLAQFWWDGTTITPTATARFAPFIDTSWIAAINSAAVSANKVNWDDASASQASHTPSATLNPLGYTFLGGTTPLAAATSFVLPADMRGTMICTMRISTTYVAGKPIFLSPLIDGLSIAPYAPYPWHVLETTFIGSIRWPIDLDNFVIAGSHTLTMGAWEPNATGTSDSTLSATGAYSHIAWIFGK